MAKRKSPAKQSTSQTEPIDFSTLDVGKTYLILGNASQFWWAARKLKPKVLLRPLAQTVLDHISVGSLYEEVLDFAILPGRSELPKDLTPASEVRTFILISEPSGANSTRTEQLAKSRTSADVLVVDLRAANYESTFKDSLETLRAEAKSFLLERYGQQPCTLARLLAKGEEEVLEEIARLQEQDDHIPTLIKSLGQPVSLQLWDRLSTHVIYGAFIEADSGLGKYPMGMPPSLTTFLHAMVYHLLPYYSRQPHLLLKLFTTWVYLSTHVKETGARDENNKGIYEYAGRQGQVLAFNPSVTSHRMIKRLLKLNYFGFNNRRQSLKIK